jgi:hypothetical protein
MMHGQKTIKLYEYVLQVWKDETNLRSVFRFMGYTKTDLKEMRPKISVKGGEFVNQMNGYIFSSISAAFKSYVSCQITVSSNCMAVLPNLNKSQRSIQNY